MGETRQQRQERLEAARARRAQLHADAAVTTEITGPIVVSGAVHCDTPGCGWIGMVTTLETAIEMLAMADRHARARRHWVQTQISWYTEEGPDPRA